MRVLGQAAGAVRRAAGGCASGSGRGVGDHDEEQGQPGGQVDAFHACVDDLCLVRWQWILLASSFGVLSKKEWKCD